MGEWILGKYRCFLLSFNWLCNKTHVDNLDNISYNSQRSKTPEPTQSEGFHLQQRQPHMEKT
jgi:hypothetical protein